MSGFLRGYIYFISTYYPIIFHKSINFIRYLNFTFFGLIGSKSFVLLLEKKSISFLRSVLGFDSKFTQIFLSTDTQVKFCGFNIRLSFLSKKLSFSFNYIRSNQKYLKKVLSRLRLNQSRFSNLLIRRFYNQLFFELEKFFFVKKFNSLISYKYFYFNERRIWNFIFQLEAIRASQSLNLISSSTKENSKFISDQFFAKIRFGEVCKYQNYNFSVYNVNLQLALKESISVFSNIFGSVLPIGSSLNNSFSEFRKKVFLYYNNFYSNNGFPSTNKSVFLNKIDPSFPISNFVGLNLPRLQPDNRIYGKLCNVYKGSVLKRRFFEVLVPMVWFLIFRKVASELF